MTYVNFVRPVQRGSPDENAGRAGPDDHGQRGRVRLREAHPGGQRPGRGARRRPHTEGRRRLRRGQTPLRGGPLTQGHTQRIAFHVILSGTTESGFR